MSELSSSNIISHWFNVNNNKGESRISYYIIVVNDLMVQLGITANFKRQDHKWDNVLVPTKEPISLLFQTDGTGCKMREVIMHTV